MRPYNALEIFCHRGALDVAGAGNILGGGALGLTKPPGRSMGALVGTIIRRYLPPGPKLHPSAWWLKWMRITTGSWWVYRRKISKHSWDAKVGTKRRG